MIPAIRLAALAAVLAAVGIGNAAGQTMPQVHDSRVCKVWTPEPVAMETPPQRSPS
jgi:hypothetical protein